VTPHATRMGEDCQCSRTPFATKDKLRTTMQHKRATIAKIKELAGKVGATVSIAGTRSD